MKKYIVSIFFLATVATLTAQPIDRSQRPEPAPAPEIKIAQADTFELPNGLKVFVVENHKLPRVSFQLSLAYDPVLEGKIAGVSSIMGDLIRTGSTTKTKDQIDREIDKIGGTFMAFDNGFYAQSLTKHRETLMGIVSDCILNSKFREEEFDKLRKQMVSSIASQRDNPNSISSKVTASVIYGKNHPYGEYATEESLSRLTLADCENYFKTYFRPNIGYLAIVGDITKEEARSLINRTLGPWQSQPVPSATYPEVKPAAVTKVSFANRESSVQSVINISNPIMLTPGAPDEIPAKVMNNILGGGASGRLFQNLREKNGYTYGAYSRISSDELVGNFSASASVRNAVTDSAVFEFISEMQRIRNNEVSEEELKRTLAFMTGSFARSLEDARTVASQAINIARYKLPQDYYANYLRTLNNVSRADVKRAAERYVLPQNAHIIIVGNGTEIRQRMNSFGQINEYDVEGNLLIATPVEKEKVKVNMASDLNADQLVDLYVKALGGMDKIKALKDYQMTMLMELPGQAVTTIFTYKAPNMTKKEVMLGTVVLNTKVFDGAKGAEKNMQGGKTDIQGKELEDLRVRSAFFPETQFKALGVKMNVKGIEELGDKLVYVMEASLPSGETVTYYFDKMTGLKIRENFRAPSPMGGFLLVTVSYDDFREVGGVKFPYKLSQRIVDPEKGPQTIELEVKDIKINQNLKKKFFTLK